MSEWRFLEGKELELVAGVVRTLWEAQTQCKNLERHRYTAIDSCRLLLMHRVPDGHLGDMPEERFPEGGDGQLDPKEAAIVLAAADGLCRIDREIESYKARIRQTLGNHGDLLKEAVGDHLKPVNLTKPPYGVVAADPEVDRPLKARGARLVSCA